MKPGCAITIAQTSNGFIAFSNDSAKLPPCPTDTATFEKMGSDRWDHGGVLGFIIDHFENKEVDETE